MNRGKADSYWTDLDPVQLFDIAGSVSDGHWRMILDAYGLSLIAVLAALSFAILRSGMLRPTVSTIVGVIGVFFLGYVVSGLTHRSEVAWSRVGQIHAPAQRAGAAEGETVLSLAPASVARGLSIRRADKIAIDIFDVASAGVLANHSVLQIPAGVKLQVAGWAADSAGGGPCKTLYLGLEKRRFALPYGFARADVATYFHDQAYTMTGYSAQVSSDTIGKGRHAVNFECLSADGKTLFVSTTAHTVTVE